MSSLLKIKVTAQLSMIQKEAAEALGGLDVLRHLEDQWGLVPSYANQTTRRYNVASIQAAIDRAEQAAALDLRERKSSKPQRLNSSKPSPPQSAAAE
jgi:hypothetical protein